MPQFLVLDEIIEEYNPVPIDSSLNLYNGYCLGAVERKKITGETLGKLFTTAPSIKLLQDGKISNEKIFLDHLELIRQNKYDVSDQEHQEEIFCVAAPIFDYNENVSMAISMSGLYSGDEIFKQELEEVKKLARKLSKYLGYHGN